MLKKPSIDLPLEIEVSKIEHASYFILNFLPTITSLEAYFALSLQFLNLFCKKAFFPSCPLSKPSYYSSSLTFFGGKDIWIIKEMEVYLNHAVRI
jgi:hypothetical protein